MQQQLNMLSSSSSPVTTTQNPKLWTPYTLSSLQSFKSSAFIPQFHTLSLTKTSITRSNSRVIKCRKSEFYEQRYSSARPSPNDSSYADQSQAGVGELPARVYVGHSIYKGKAALTVEPKSPEFTALDSGAFKVAREGFVLLQFAPAAGVRQYDWSRKQVFSLSVMEIGTLISLGARDSCEFFHDPNKGKMDEGKVRKVLKVEPLPDGSGHFFNLSVQNKPMNMDESIYIPVTKAEFAVLMSAFNYILPYLLGWHTFANSIKPDVSGYMNNAIPRFGGDYEWSK